MWPNGLKPRYIRCGQSKEPSQTDDVLMLQRFWEMEEQMGIRKKPIDTALRGIPEIILAAAPPVKPVERLDEGKDNG